MIEPQPLTATSLRQRIAGYEAMAAADRRDVKERGPRPDRSIAALFDLIQLQSDLHGWPPRRTAQEEAETDRVRRAWSRLRAIQAP